MIYQFIDIVLFVYVYLIEVKQWIHQVLYIKHIV